MDLKIDHFISEAGNTVILASKVQRIAFRTQRDGQLTSMLRCNSNVSCHLHQGRRSVGDHSSFEKARRGRLPLRFTSVPLGSTPLPAAVPATRESAAGGSQVQKLLGL